MAGSFRILTRTTRAACEKWLSSRISVFSVTMVSVASTRCLRRCPESACIAMETVLSSSVLVDIHGCSDAWTYTSAIAAIVWIVLKLCALSRCVALFVRDHVMSMSNSSERDVHPYARISWARYAIVPLVSLLCILCTLSASTPSPMYPTFPLGICYLSVFTISCILPLLTHV